MRQHPVLFLLKLYKVILGVFLFAFALSLFNPGKVSAEVNTSGQIVSNSYSDKCIDLSGNNRADETPVQLYNCIENNNAQRWEYNSSNHRITLMDDYSKCLDLNHNYQNDGEKIKIMPCTSNNPAQEWFVTSDGQIQLYSNRTVCIDASANYSGAKVYLYHCHGGTNQKWYFSHKNAINYNKEGVIQRFNTNRCIDGGIYEGNYATLKDCTAGSLSQQWFYDVGTRQIRLEIDRNKCLDLTNNQQTDGTRIKLISCKTNEPAQRWVLDGKQIRLDYNRYYCLSNDSSQDNGARMELRGCDLGTGQDWDMNLSTQQVLGEGALKLKDSDKVIDAPTRGNLDRVHLWDLHTYNANQIWIVESGQIKLKETSYSGSGKCLNVPYRTEGTQVTVWDCIPGESGQQFKLIGDRLKLEGTNLCVDSPTRNNDGKIHLWTCNGDNPNQRWMIAKRDRPGACPLITGQFCGEYYSSIEGVGTFKSPQYTQNTSSINYNWGNGSPANLPTDNFSVRWSGRFNFEYGMYRFTTNSDDGVIVRIDGAYNPIDLWNDHGPTVKSSVIPLTSGYHDVEVYYYEKSGGSVISASWQKLDV